MNRLIIKVLHHDIFWLIVLPLWHSVGVERIGFWGLWHFLTNRSIEPSICRFGRVKRVYSWVCASRSNLRSITQLLHLPLNLVRNVVGLLVNFMGLWQHWDRSDWIVKRGCLKVRKVHGVIKWRQSIVLVIAFLILNQGRIPKQKILFNRVSAEWIIHVFKTKLISYLFMAFSLWIVSLYI